MESVRPVGVYSRAPKLQRNCHKLSQKFAVFLSPTRWLFMRTLHIDRVRQRLFEIQEDQNYKNFPLAKHSSSVTIVQKIYPLQFCNDPFKTKKTVSDSVSDFMANFHYFANLPCVVANISGTESNGGMKFSTFIRLLELVCTTPRSP